MCLLAFSFHTSFSAVVCNWARKLLYSNVGDAGLAGIWLLNAGKFSIAAFLKVVYAICFFSLLLNELQIWVLLIWIHMCMVYYRCAICLSCGSNDPGFNCMWQKSFTECGPCASHTTCPSCLEGYNEGDLIIQCVQCERFVLRSISVNITAVLSYCYWISGLCPLSFILERIQCFRYWISISTSEKVGICAEWNNWYCQFFYITANYEMVILFPHQKTAPN